MQLEGAKAELRSRPPYEAADLGVRLLRALFGPAARAWLSFVLPVQLCALLACSPFTFAWSGLALWWLKPVYDRAWGLVLGHGLFGEAPTGWALYRRLWSDGRRGLVGDLLWRRLDPARTLVAPVALLEGLSGGVAARRRRTLGEGTMLKAGFVLAACLGIELAATAGWVVGAILLVPQEAAWMAEELWPVAWDDVFPRLILGAYALSISMVEPLFVASGFGLYVNRRTNLEGWDVELSFRRMSRRLALKATAGALLLWSWSALPGAAPRSAAAQDDGDAAGAERARASEEAVTRSAVDDAERLPAPPLRTDAESAQAMARVLARPELLRTHVEEHWELRRSRDEAPEPDGTWPWLHTLAGVLARGLEVGLWAVAALAIAVLMYVILERKPALRARRSAAAAVPVPARVRPGAAPAPPLPTREVVAKALALLAEGQDVKALSVLYVGTLTALLRQDGLALPPQATEGQCLAAVRTAPVSAERRSLFVEVTALWQSSAYAHVRPERGRLEEICERFTACFGNTR